MFLNAAEEERGQSLIISRSIPPRRIVWLAKYAAYPASLAPTRQMLASLRPIRQSPHGHHRVGHALLPTASGMVIETRQRFGSNEKSKLPLRTNSRNYLTNSVFCFRSLGFGKAESSKMSGPPRLPLPRTPAPSRELPRQHQIHTLPSPTTKAAGSKSTFAGLAESRSRERCSDSHFRRGGS